MPSCNSNSSNILSGLNTLNITQGSGGSRLIVSIPRVAGLTIGNVIRYDVASSGYTASKADTAVNAEVFGIVESYIPTTDKLSVVLNGSISLDSSYFLNRTDDPSGAGGGNDIYFLSGTTAGLLENLAPLNSTHVVKPIYQKAPHGTYTGSVVNYSGYRIGGDVQSILDSKNLTGKVGTIQFAFEDLQALSGDEQLLMQEFYSGRGTDVPALFQLDPDVYKDWNLEFLRVDRPVGILDNLMLRPIDFPQFLSKSYDENGSLKYGPGWNWTIGWIEKIKIDDGVAFPNLTTESVVFQFNHSNYSNNPIVDTCYGKVWAWDSANRFIWIYRPATKLFDPVSGNDLGADYRIDSPLMFEKNQSDSSTGTIRIGTVPANNPNDFSNWSLTSYTIRTTTRNTQFVAMIMTSLQWNVNFINAPESGLGFFTLYNEYSDPINPNLALTNYFSAYSLNPSIYVKVKDKGSTVSIPQEVTIANLNAGTIDLTGIGDLKTALDDILSRLSSGGL